MSLVEAPRSAPTWARARDGEALIARQDWPASYRRGSHCFSTMISNIFAGTGFDIGEELAYVIGGGLGLLFYRDGDTFYINSRMHDLEHFFARRTGSRVEFVSHPDADAMLESASTWAAAGLLPYLYCEARELSVFSDVLPWEAVHPFGEHALPVRSVTGAGDVVGNDYLWAHPVTLPYRDVVRATSMPSDGILDMACPARTFAVGRLIPPARAPELGSVLAESIAENAELFLNPTNNTQGVRALKTLERDIASMPELVGADRVRIELISMATMLEKIGTGGGAGRHLYARGLRASAAVLASADLRGLADAFSGLGGRWRQLARRMQRHAAATEPRAEWPSLVQAVREIRRDEVAAVSRLQDVSEALVRSAA